MEQIVATRSELLARRSQIVLVKQGRDVLKAKREQLMDELRNVADRVVAREDALEEAAAAGRRALAWAEAADGPSSVASAGMSTRVDLPLHVRTISIMGLRIADIAHDPVGRPRTGRGYSLGGTSPYVDRAASQFEAQLDLLLELARTELRLRRLVDEIARTTRRVNALESVVLPRLGREQAFIESVLEERERQEHFRLKRFTTRRGGRLEAGGAR